MQHFDFTHCATSRGLLSNIFAAPEEAEEFGGRRSPESLIFGMALSLSEEGEVISALCVCPGRHSGRTGEGVRERSELVGQSGPVDIGSGDDGDEDADSDLEGCGGCC